MHLFLTFICCCCGKIVFEIIHPFCGASRNCAKTQFKWKWISAQDNHAAAAEEEELMDACAFLLLLMLRESFANKLQIFSALYDWWRLFSQINYSQLVVYLRFVGDYLQEQKNGGVNELTHNLHSHSDLCPFMTRGGSVSESQTQLTPREMMMIKMVIFAFALVGITRSLPAR